MMDVGVQSALEEDVTLSLFAVEAPPLSGGRCRLRRATGDNMGPT